jgi:hypothetical protein
MKKILAALTLIALIFTACTETETAVTVSLSKTTATELGLASQHSHMMITVSNSTDNEATIQWERSETTPVTGWTYNVNGSSVASGALTIPANGSVEVTLMVIPNGNVGEGSGMLKFYDSEDQSATMKEFNYTLTAVSQYFEVIAIDAVSKSVRTTDPLETDFKLKVYNPNTTDITVNWASEAGASNPTAWILNVCDPFTCFGPAVVDGTFPVPAGDSVDFKFTLNHASTTGTGTAMGSFYIATDSTASLTTQSATLTVN